jgi:hypothetical protein
VKPGAPKPEPTVPQLDQLPPCWTSVAIDSEVMGGWVLIARTETVAQALAAQTSAPVLVVSEIATLEHVRPEDIREAVRVLGRRRRRAVQ